MALVSVITFYTFVYIIGDSIIVYVDSSYRFTGVKLIRHVTFQVKCTLRVYVTSDCFVNLLLTEVLRQCNLQAYVALFLNCIRIRIQLYDEKMSSHFTVHPRKKKPCVDEVTASSLKYGKHNIISPTAQPDSNLTVLPVLDTKYTVVDSRDIPALLFHRRTSQRRRTIDCVVTKENRAAQSARKWDVLGLGRKQE